jgi:hypothetical protein
MADAGVEAGASWIRFAMSGINCRRSGLIARRRVGAPVTQSIR